MIHSMTAYGSAEDSGSWGNACCEIRSINYRYLDITIHLPEKLQCLEKKIRALIGDRLRRGKVGLKIRLEYDDSNVNLLVNEALLNKLIKVIGKIDTQLNITSKINTLEVLQWPNILSKETVTPTDINEVLLNLVARALDETIAGRKNEGEKIKHMLLDRCKSVKTHITQVRYFLPEIIDSHREKLRQKADKISVTLDPQRLEQELLLFLQKVDIAEELDRLDAHVDEVSRVVNQKKAVPVGRKLDFLMQEMHREANTLAAKSVHLASTNIAVALKVLIEEMREQIQNIE